MKINNTTLLIIAVTVVLILAILAALIWAGREPDQIIYLIIALIGPVIPGVANYAKTQKLASQVNDVQTKVNGRMTQLIEKATSAGHQLPEDVYEGLDAQPGDTP